MQIPISYYVTHFSFPYWPITQNLTQCLCHKAPITQPLLQCLFTLPFHTAFLHCLYRNLSHNLYRNLSHCLFTLPFHTAFLHCLFTQPFHNIEFAFQCKCCCI
jgi:hypothetical protein